MHEGGCLCGTVRFKVSREPINVRICHCRLCQKSMAAPFYARALFETDAVKLEGPTGLFPSSDRLNRVFCKSCGTRIGTSRSDGSAIGLAIALFDDRNAFAPADHIWTSEKIAWLAIEDGLPQHSEGPPV